MKYMLILLVGLFIPKIFSQTPEDELKNYLATIYEKLASEKCESVASAFYDYTTNPDNLENELIIYTALTASTVLDQLIWELYFKNLNSNDYKDPLLKRQIDMCKIQWAGALEYNDFTYLVAATNDIIEINNRIKICPYTNPNCDTHTEGLSLKPDIKSIFAKSSDYNELLYTWQTWYDLKGSLIEPFYEIYVTITNKMAVANNFSDMSDMLGKIYCTENFEDNIEDLWFKLEPLYTELHTYVKFKLAEHYSFDLDLSDGLLPAHILGDLWGQDWTNLYPLVAPYPSSSNLNLDKALVDQGYTVPKMFQTADHFFQSLGLESASISYDVNQGAVIEKLTDGREMICEAGAFDFCDGQNYRVRMCGEVNFEDFIAIHHELAYIQYFMQYKNQSYTFRSAPNPSFYKAVGDTIGLSVANPKHLKTIGLLNDDSDGAKNETSINALMLMALQKIPALPFSLAVDKWRWNVFSSSVTPDNWNKEWWQYREVYQKVRPPTDRYNTSLFDFAFNYHDSDKTQYASHFYAQIMQFQLYKSLCTAAGEYDDSKKLHECDFYDSKEAGDKLKAGLSLGASQDWRQVLKVMIGESDLNVEPLLEYFEPLYNYLKEFNEEHLLIIM